jgi:CubicO group peptidase (beta-lactamase class C family)
MKRVLIVVLVVAAIAAGTVDWRFWKRWYTIPEDAGEWPASYYQPTVAIPGDERAFFPVATDDDERTIEAAALEAAADYAESHNSAALLVLHRGVVQLERYWQGIGPESLFTGRAMTRSLIPPLFAIAMAEGDISSLDDPVGNYLTEWQDDPRGEITIRELMWNLSGLENTLLVDGGPFSKEVRISLGSDFRAAAVSFEIDREAGTHFSFSNTNPQLLGAVLESATGRDYEDYLQEKLWAPLGASAASIYMDRPGGMPAVYCCYRATPRDWLRYGYALLNDGSVNGEQIWPAGWVKEMTSGSPVNPGYGYQIWVGNPVSGVREYIQGSGRNAPHGEGIDNDTVFFLEGGGYRTMYVIPDQDLVILRLGYADSDWQTSAIPNLVLAGIGGDEPIAEARL